MSAQHKGPRHKVPALLKVADGGNIDGTTRKNFLASLNMLAVGAGFLSRSIEDIRDEAQTNTTMKLLPYDEEWLAMMDDVCDSVARLKPLAAEIATRVSLIRARDRTRGAK